jgi:YD repeat-containing protein
MGTIDLEELRLGTSAVESRAFTFGPSRLPISNFAYEKTHFGGFERHYRRELRQVTVTRGTLSWTTQYFNFDSLSRPSLRSETGDGQARTSSTAYQDLTASTGFYRFRNLVRIEGTYVGGVAGGATTGLRIRQITRTFQTIDSPPQSNPFGTMTSETKDGVTRSYGYDISGELASVWEGDGVTTIRNLQRTDMVGGRLRDIRTGQGVRWQLTSDALGSPDNKLVLTTPTAGWLTQTPHDVLHRLVQVIPWHGSATTTTTIQYSPDARFRRATKGRLIATERFDGLGRLVATETGTITPNIRTRLRRYDSCGQVTGDSHVFSDGDAAWAQLNPASIHWETYLRDTLGRVTQTTHSGGTTVVTQFDLSSVHGERVTDEMANVVDRQFASFGDPTQYEIVQVTSGGSIVRYQRDVLGHLLQVTRPDGNTDTFHYNAYNFMDRETHPESGPTTYTPDSLNRVSTRRDGAGRRATYSYDVDSRLIQVDYAGTATLAAETLRYSYLSNVDATQPVAWPFLTSAQRGTTMVSRWYNPDETLRRELTDAWACEYSDVTWSISPEGFDLGYVIQNIVNVIGLPTVSITTNSIVSSARTGS